MGGKSVFPYPGRGYLAVYLRLTWYGDNIGPGRTWEDFGRSYESVGGASSGYCTFV